MPWFILLIFFFSGFLGLGYQVLWGSWLYQFIGTGVFSYAVLLCAFMGGLALGGHQIGKYADKHSSPLTIYAILEILIAIWAFLVFQPVIENGKLLYIASFQWFPAESAALPHHFIKLFVATFAIFPPAWLMGGTYPVLVRNFSASLFKNSSILYGINALGAGAGAFCIAFWMLPSFGKTATLILLGFLSALIGLLSWLFSRSQEPKIPVKSDLSVHISPLFLFFIFASGLLSFAMEILWIRFFGIVLGSSTYSFALMLSAMITAIGLGSILLSFFTSKIQNPGKAFAFFQIFSGLFLLIILPFLPALIPISKTWLSLFSIHGSGFLIHQAGNAAMTFLIIFPWALFNGVTLPLMIQACDKASQSPGKISGQLYAFNTLGNITGSILASLSLLPLLGLENSIRLTALLYILGAFLFLFLTKIKVGIRTSLPLAVATIAFLFAPAWDLSLMTVSPHRRWNLGFDFLFSPDKDTYTAKVLFYKDDPTSNLIVSKRAEQISLRVNGKPDAGTGEDMPTQILVGQIPLFLHTQADNVLVIGLGSGVTVGSVLTHPVKRVDVVELSPSMQTAAEFFSEQNQKPWEDPRYHLHIEDARSWLMHTDKTFDVVISEPSNPWHEGVASLFTLEYYEQIEKKLNPNGIFLQWVQGYELSDRNISMIFATIQKVFPWIYVFHAAHSDFLFLSSKTKIKPDFNFMKSLFENEKIQKNLKTIQIENIKELLWHQGLTPRASELISGTSETLHLDNFLDLQYLGPKDLFSLHSPKILSRMDQRNLANPELFIFSDGWLPDPAFIETSLKKNLVSERFLKPWLLALNAAQIANPLYTCDFAMQYPQSTHRLIFGMDTKTSFELLECLPEEVLKTHQEDFLLLSLIQPEFATRLTKKLDTFIYDQKEKNQITTVSLACNLQIAVQWHKQDKNLAKTIQICTGKKTVFDALLLSSLICGETLFQKPDTNCQAISSLHTLKDSQ